MACGTDGVGEREGRVALPAAQLEDAGAGGDGEEGHQGEAVGYLRVEAGRGGCEEVEGELGGEGVGCHVLWRGIVLWDGFDGFEGIGFRIVIWKFSFVVDGERFVDCYRYEMN